MTGLQLILLVSGVVLAIPGFNAFIHWSERRDAISAVRDIQALRNCVSPPSLAPIAMGIECGLQTDSQTLSELNGTVNAIRNIRA